MPLIPTFLLGALIGAWITSICRRDNITVRKIDGFDFCRMHGIGVTRVIDAKFEDLK